MHCSLGKGIAALAFGAVAGASQAVVIYNNFGSGSDYGWFDGDSQGWGVYGPGIMPGGQWVYEAFDTGSFSGSLASITLGVSLIEGTNDVMVNLLADHAGMPDDSTVLGTWHLTNLVAWGADPTPAPETISVSSINLLAGTRYWVEVAPGAEGTYADWGWADPAVPGAFAIGSSGGVSRADGNLSALRLEGDSASVPGPAAVVPFAVGLLALRRRRR